MPSKPKLSGETLFGTPPPTASRTPHRKRTQSNASSSNSSGRRREEDDFFFGEEEEKTQGEKLADVLYGRWLEGLRNRWEGNF
jgi:hypothetical protein